ncbi:ATPase domain-containing protein [Archaeoglobus veneficus]|uniref:Putative circadian clock protein, KaiC n=1 Tax=Archaeoglobus veneficus (strain DSM 11195 / SNP6) TaxID=693661 RepID=F2KSF4_ARCVS|nr:ATPase domain-containing protein [Archaeoglobus veneficus]AEA46923.1 putative circadian clock protein, KaiC [Archaeoglobus veneficus SNP6]
MQHSSNVDCPTGIEELDALLDGGFPRGSVILLKGDPGAGKTTFAAKFIYEGITKYGEPGIYISFAEPFDEFYRFMKLLGMDFNIDNFCYLEFHGFDEDLLASNILEAIVDSNAMRVAIDSITALTAQFGARARLFLNTLNRKLKAIGTTSILVSDTPSSHLEDFVADGVINFKTDVENGLLTRRMEIRKLRGKCIRIAEIPFAVLPGKGLFLFPLCTAKPVRGLSSEVIKTGIPTIDRAIGGIPRTSLTLITGVSGSGKTMLAAQMAANISRELSVAYVSLEEPEEQVERKLAEFGAKDVMVVSLNPASVSSEEIFARIMGYNSDVFFIDGLRLLRELREESRFWYCTVNSLVAIKNRGATVIYTYAADYPLERISVDTLADVLLLLRYDGTKRKLSIWKHRNLTAPNREFDVRISGGRVEVMD